MERILGTYRSLHEACMDWVEKWALTLAFSLTQNVEESEKLVADAIVAVLAATTEEELSTRFFSDHAVKLSQKIYNLSHQKPVKSNAHDVFFKLPQLIRAVVVLKLKSRFSLKQIAQVFDASTKDIEMYLESARLHFSKGRSWLHRSPQKIQLDDARLVEPCPEPEDGRLYAKYLENDLSSEDTHLLHQHFVGCTLCRANLVHFKSIYSDWVFSVPEPENTPAMQAYFRKVAQMALRARMTDLENPLPQFIPGFLKTVRDPKTLLLLAAVGVFFYLIRL